MKREILSFLLIALIIAFFGAGIFFHIEGITGNTISDINSQSAFGIGVILILFATVSAILYFKRKLG